METIIIATIKQWNITNFFALQEKYKKRYNFVLIQDTNQLTYEYLQSFSPQYIFFPHWSWIIPQKIYENFECIVFHMSDLPYGRGGSPLQNLIIRGVYHTKISALKVSKGIDTGDIYFKEDFDLSKGSAHELFVQLSNIIFEKMIPKFFHDKISAQKQEGKVVNFPRRTQKQSDLTSFNAKDIKDLYDFIRMLDAPDYPKAYIKLGKFKVEFENVERRENQLNGNFKVTLDE